MPLLNNQNQGAGAAAPAGAATPTGGSQLTGEARKKENERKLKEKRKQQKLDICAFLEKQGNLPKEIADIVHDWKNPRAGGGGNFGEPLFNKIFGATPKVGDKVTLQDVFNRTFKGVDKMNELMKKWKDKNTATVEYVHNAQAPLMSEYVIKAMG